MATTGITVVTGAKILAPLIKDLYEGAKRIGSNQFDRWSANQFPSRLAKKISKFESVKTLWQFNKEVSIRKFYYPIAVVLDEKNVRRIDSLAELHDLKLGPVVIEGIVGQGKSMFLRYLCIQELSEKGSGRLPIFIELRSLKPGQSLISSILRELQTYDINATAEALHYLAKSGKITILLDGFDELDYSLISSVIEEIELLLEKHEALFIVVASRPDCAIQKSTPFNVVRLAPIKAADHVPFLSKLGLQRTRANEVAAAIRESPNDICELIVTPLMLTLTVMVYQSEKSIPPLLADFFEALFSTVFTRHDKTKPGFERRLQSELGERTLQKLFETFCFMCAQAELTRTLSAEEFATTYEKAAKYFTEGSATVEDFKYDISKVAGLMAEEGVGAMTFLHKSIAEFFAASFIRRAHQSAAEKFYSAARRDFRRWAQVLAFLSKIDQFRYYSLFLVPELQECLEEFPDGASTSEGVLRSFIEANTSGLGINIEQRPYGYKITGIISYSDITLQDYGYAMQELLRILLGRAEIASADFEDIARPQRETNGESLPRLPQRGVAIPLPELNRRIGYEWLYRSFRIGIQSLQRQLDSAKALVAVEERKDDIF